MRRECARSRGRIALAWLLVIIPAFANAATALQTSIEPSSIEVGETATLQIEMPGGDLKPVSYPSVPGLKIENAGVQRTFRFENGRSWSGSVLLFSVTALRKGRFHIPPFVFRRGDDTLKSASVELNVTDGPEGSSPAGPHDIRSSVECSTTSLYVGQPMVLRYYVQVSGTNVRVHQFHEPPATKGFVVKMIDDPVHNAPPSQVGGYEKAHVVSLALIPTIPGTYRVGGGSAIITVVVPNRRRGDDFFPNFPGFNFPVFEETQTRELPFEQKTITVRPLPGGAPEGFKGDVGSFVMKASFDEGGIEVFGEKKVTVTVEGSGNLVAMSQPVPAPEVPGVKVIAEEGTSELTIEGDSIKGARQFVFTLIPEKPGKVETAFQFVAFNPQKGLYETIRTQMISFAAKGGKRRERESFDEEPSSSSEFNPLYILLIAVLLAGAVAFVVIWERRRLAIVTGSAQDNKPEEGPTQDDPDYLNEVRRCAAKNDAEGFLRYAERAIDRALRSNSAITDENRREIARLREELYGYKFGRVRISKEDIKRIEDAILRLARR